MEKVLGRKPRHTDVEAPTWVLKMLGNSFTAGEFVLAMRQWNTFTRQMGTFHQKYDIFLTPTLAFPAGQNRRTQTQARGKGPHEDRESRSTWAGSSGCRGSWTSWPSKTLPKTPFTQLANLTGQPAVSVPMHWTPDGLPCGVQLIAPFGDEATLFRLCGQLEKARPWFDKRP